MRLHRTTLDSDGSVEQENEAIFSTALPVGGDLKGHISQWNKKAQEQNKLIKKNARTGAVNSAESKNTHVSIEAPPTMHTGGTYKFSEQCLEFLEPIVCRWMDPVSFQICGQSFSKTTSIAEHMSRFHTSDAVIPEEESVCFWSDCPTKMQEVYTKEALRRHVQYHTGN